MNERTALGEQILKHWREHLPQMVRDLKKENRLNGAIQEAQDLTADLLYELVSVKKIDYQAAWEMATRQWAFLPAGKPARAPSSRTSKRPRKKSSRRGTSR
jgi:hypothetical protein